MREFGDSGENVVNLKGGLLAKSGKLIFQGRSFLEGKIQKNGKNFLKHFIVPKHLLGLPTKAILSTLVSRKNAKKQQK